MVASEYVSRWSGDYMLDRDSIAEYCAIVGGVFSVLALIAMTSMYRGDRSDAVASHNQPIRQAEAR
jgi:hypothetical protein